VIRQRARRIKHAHQWAKGGSNGRPGGNAGRTCEGRDFYDNQTALAIASKIATRFQKSTRGRILWGGLGMADFRQRGRRDEHRRSEPRAGAWSSSTLQPELIVPSVSLPAESRQCSVRLASNTPQNGHYSRRPPSRIRISLMAIPMPAGRRPLILPELGDGQPLRTRDIVVRLSDV